MRRKKRPFDDHRSMTLRPVTPADLHVMISWFPDQQSCRNWGGPEFRFPFSEQSFLEDAQLQTLPSYSYCDDDRLLAFGQYYLRAGRCHLARLAVAPAERGKGHGTRLIVALLDCGSTALGTTECSLFVSTSNPRAARLYERLGFTEMQYPDPTLMIPASYMVAEITAVRERSSAAC